MRTFKRLMLRRSLSSPIVYAWSLRRDPPAPFPLFFCLGFIIKRVGSVAIAIAYSSISRGKSNCCRVAIAICRNYPKGCVTHLSESHAHSYLASGLPFLYDDPSSDRVLKPLLMNAFGGAEMGTSKNQLSANCSPIVTANEHIIEQLSLADDRCVIVIV